MNFGSASLTQTYEFEIDVSTPGVKHHYFYSVTTSGNTLIIDVISVTCGLERLRLPDYEDVNLDPNLPETPEPTTLNFLLYQNPYEVDLRPVKYLTEFDWFSIDTSHINDAYNTTLDDTELAMFGKCSITDYVLCEDYLCRKLAESENAFVYMEESTAAIIASDTKAGKVVLEKDIHEKADDPIPSARRLLNEDEKFL
jgi:hypothetical protein